MQLTRLQEELRQLLSESRERNRQIQSINKAHSCEHGTIPSHVWYQKEQPRPKSRQPPESLASFKAVVTLNDATCSQRDGEEQEVTKSPTGSVHTKWKRCAEDSRNAESSQRSPKRLCTQQTPISLPTPICSSSSPHVRSPETAQAHDSISQDPTSELSRPSLPLHTPPPDKSPKRPVTVDSSVNSAKIGRMPKPGGSATTSSLGTRSGASKRSNDAMESEQQSSLVSRANSSQNNRPDMCNDNLGDTVMPNRPPNADSNDSRVSALKLTNSKAPEKTLTSKSRVGSGGDNASKVNEHGGRAGTARQSLPTSAQPNPVGSSIPSISQAAEPNNHPRLDQENRQVAKNTGVITSHVKGTLATGAISKHRDDSMHRPHDSENTRALQMLSPAAAVKRATSQLSKLSFFQTSSNTTSQHQQNPSQDANSASVLRDSQTIPLSAKSRKLSTAERLALRPRLDRYVPHDQRTTDEELIRIGRYGRTYDRHISAPYAFRYDGKLFAEYKYLVDEKDSDGAGWDDALRKRLQ